MQIFLTLASFLIGAKSITRFTATDKTSQSVGAMLVTPGRVLSTLIHVWKNVVLSYSVICILIRRIEQALEAGRKRQKSRFFYRKWLRNNTRAFSVGSRARFNKNKNGLQINLTGRKPLFCLEFNKPDKRNVITWIYLNNS